MTGTGSGDEQGPGAVAVQMRAEEQSLAHVASFLPAYLSCSAKLALRFPNSQSASSEPRVSPPPAQPRDPPSAPSTATAMFFLEVPLGLSSSFVESL